MSQNEDQSKGRTVVRRALVSDIPQMVMIGRLFADESGYAKHGVIADPMRLHESLKEILASDTKAAFVADLEGRIVGVAAAAQFSNYFSSAILGIELFWWVSDHTRGSRAAIGLLNSMEQWAREAGCSAFCMVDLAAVDGPAAKIYRRRGYEIAERTWIRRLD